jgi:hypothetical protein
MPAKPSTVSATIALIQGLLVLVWTLYVLFLPPMAQAAGLSRSWVVWLLLADQVVFVLGDWASGVHADRLARSLRSVGLLVLGAAVVSGALLVTLPDIAALGSRPLFIAAVLAWAASSSLLRAPVFSLLGRIGGVSRKSGVVNGALVGVCLASAVGPLLTERLIGLDPRVPLLLASAALVVATLPLLRIDAASRTSAPARAVSRPILGAVLVITLTTWLAAVGVQLFTVLAPAQAHPLDATAKALWAPLYWSGFAVGLLGGALTRRSSMPMRWVAAALMAGAIAMLTARNETVIGALAVCLTLGGAAWAIVYVSALRAVLELGRGCALGTPLGVFLSALSLAAGTRLLLTATGWGTRIDGDMAGAAAWVLAALVLLAQSARRRRAGRAAGDVPAVQT